MGKSVQNSNSLMDFVVIPQLQFLHLARNYWLRDENIRMFSSIFSNLQLHDLSYCNNISEEGICQFVRCSKIRHLNLAHFSIMEHRGMNFKAPKLEVLNLSNTRIDDEALYVISISCRGLLKLLQGMLTSIPKTRVDTNVVWTVNC